MFCYHYPLRALVLSLFCVCFADDTFAQTDRQAPQEVGQPQDATKNDDPTKIGDTKQIVIPDEPKAIDPAQFVYKPLRKKVTVSFDGTSIREVVAWIKKELGVAVLVDESAFADEGILLSDPVTDQLTDQPAYLLLDRLSSIMVGWYIEDEILHITSESASSVHVLPATINVGEFFDSGFDSPNLIDTIQTSTRGWLDTEGEAGTLVLLGDVLFMQQTNNIRRTVLGLLEGLKKHGRQTFVGDAVEHLEIRKKLDARISVDFDEVALVDVLTKISELAGTNLRTDVAVFRDMKLRDRMPISLTLKEQKFSTVLGALTAKLKLTWTLKDGTVLLTSEEAETENVKIAIYDVRDLCRNLNEANALLDAVMTQVAPESWSDTNGGTGQISFPKSGLMVVSQTEKMHTFVLRQLQAYRQALKTSKIREKKDPSQEPETLYYKMPTPIAMQLQISLKELVATESWKSDKNPKAIGTIKMLPSKPTLYETQGKAVPILGENSVLIIHQTREIHAEISTLVNNIENGNSKKGGGLGGLGGGGGGGGFGGGLFSLPNKVDVGGK